MLDALVVLGAKRSDVEADEAADGAIGSNGALTLEPLEVAVDSDRARAAWRGTRRWIRPGRGPCPGSLVAASVGQTRSLARRARLGFMGCLLLIACRVIFL